jgi:hypothetical protein
MTRPKGKAKRRAWGWSLLGWLLLFGALGIVPATVVSLQEQRRLGEIPHWPTTPGTVLSATVEWQPSRYHRDYFARIQYTCVVVRIRMDEAQVQARVVDPGPASAHRRHRRNRCRSVPLAVRPADRECVLRHGGVRARRRSAVAASANRRPSSPLGGCASRAPVSFAIVAGGPVARSSCRQHAPTVTSLAQLAIQAAIAHLARTKSGPGPRRRTRRRDWSMSA